MFTCADLFKRERPCGAKELQMLQSYVPVKLFSLLQSSPESAWTIKVLLGMRLKDQLFLPIAPLTVAA